jgi:hypothetical protein
LISGQSAVDIPVGYVYVQESRYIGRKSKKWYLQIGSEQTDGIRMPEPGELILDVADRGLQVTVQRDRKPTYHTSTNANVGNGVNLLKF